jgi:hypothetical protein
MFHANQYKSLSDLISTEKSRVWWHRSVTSAMTGSLKQDGTSSLAGKKSQTSKY